MHQPVGGFRQPDLREHGVRSGTGAAPAVSEQPRHHDQVLAAGQRRLDGGSLTGQPDDLAYALGVGGGVDAGHAQRPLVGREQRGDRSHERGLAGTVRTEDRRDGAGRGDEVQAVEGDHGAEGLAEARGLDGGKAHATTMTMRSGHRMTTSVLDPCHMRADRLVATLLVMQARGRITAAELAEELEVSVKTARRDLEALAIAGIPVYSQPGKGGGWTLLGGARTDLSGLTAAEARTLFMIAGPSSTATPEAKAALRKLVQALPETFRADAEAAASAIVLDPAGWGATAAPPPPHLDVLQRAVIDGVQVQLAYADRTRSESVRTVHPLGLVEKRSVWYLVANTDAGMRTFRVGRVKGVTVTDDPVVRPKDFDLAETWQSVVETIESRRTSTKAVVNAPPYVVGGLRGQFGPTARCSASSTMDGSQSRSVGRRRRCLPSSWPGGATSWRSSNHRRCASGCTRSVRSWSPATPVDPDRCQGRAASSTAGGRSGG